ncbi:MAG: hypothetical protein HSCHL_2411 [Hydrogenibacillus schlegelii]|uniref:Prolipoprotein diacylglyceryl transferase n=1 Tax=Hydrogenibacillus schlegelii TaxID=1484 RepID=A0A2T5GF86_HYDSH|nr:hypothetical protein [Hydrogenibacillus schlegelii]PTQ54820.1 MAG: hypothetical protein HSCHL_2411 [Hydrogenibacillus schlegelii]
MLNVDWLLLLLAFGVAGAVVARALPPAERARATDVWTAVGLAAVVGWKLTPLLFHPGLLLDPLRLWLLQSGDVGLGVGGASAAIAFFYMERKAVRAGGWASVFRSFRWLLVVALAGYGLWGLFDAVRRGEAISLVRAAVAVPAFWAAYRSGDRAPGRPAGGRTSAQAGEAEETGAPPNDKESSQNGAPPSAGSAAPPEMEPAIGLTLGLLLLAESLEAVRLYAGLSPLQWAAVAAAGIYGGLYGLARRGTGWTGGESVSRSPGSADPGGRRASGGRV